MVSSIERFHCTVQWELCIVQWPHALHTRITWNEHSPNQYTHFYLHSPDELKPSVSMLFKVGYVLLKVKLIVDRNTIRMGTRLAINADQLCKCHTVKEMQRKCLWRRRGELSFNAHAMALNCMGKVLNTCRETFRPRWSLSVSKLVTVEDSQGQMSHCN